MFLNFSLVPVLSALENVMLPVQIQGVAEHEARECAASALVDVGHLSCKFLIEGSRAIGQCKTPVGVAYQLSTE